MTTTEGRAAPSDPLQFNRPGGRWFIIFDCRKFWMFWYSP
jgi:hypothetical protein